MRSLLSEVADSEPGHRPARPAVAGLILAAGAATRLGEPKAAAVAHGSTFAAHVAKALRAGGISRLLAMVGVHEQDARQALAGIDHVEFATVHSAERGPIASLAQGLEILARDPRYSGVVVAPVDHPSIQAATVAALCQGAIVSGQPIVVPVFAGRRGHPTYFAREIWPEFAANDLIEGARTVVRRSPARVHEVPVSDAGILRNIDTPESLRLWRQSEQNMPESRFGR